MFYLNGLFEQYSKMDVMIFSQEDWKVAMTKLVCVFVLFIFYVTCYRCDASNSYKGKVKLQRGALEWPCIFFRALTDDQSLVIPLNPKGMCVCEIGVKNE